MIGRSSSTRARVNEMLAAPPRRFAVAQVRPRETDGVDGTSVPSSIIGADGCNQCGQLLKRCLSLTNQLFLHDHAACRDQNARLAAERDQARAAAAAAATNARLTAGGSDGTSTTNAQVAALEAAVKQLEHEKLQLQEQLAKQQQQSLVRSAPPATPAGVDVDAVHEVVRLKHELGRVRVARDGLELRSLQHEKREVDSLALLAEHEARAAAHETRRAELEHQLSARETELGATHEQASVLQGRVDELEAQWARKLAEDRSAQSWEDRLQASEAESHRLESVISDLEREVSRLRDFEYLYRDASNRMKLMESDVSLSSEYQSSLKESQMRCGLLENEVRSLRVWEASHRELSQKVAVLERVHAADREWETKFKALERTHASSLHKISEMNIVLIEHRQCHRKIEEAKRDAQKTVKSAEVRRAVQDTARASFAQLKPSLGCEFADHRLGALVSKVREGTPAARAGVRVKDIVVSAGGQTVANRVGMAHACSRFAPGDALPLNLLRGKGQRAPVTAEVEVGASGLTPEEVRDLRRRMDGNITDDDLRQHLAREEAKTADTPQTPAPPPIVLATGVSVLATPSPPPRSSPTATPPRLTPSATPLRTPSPQATLTAAAIAAILPRPPPSPSASLSVSSSTQQLQPYELRRGIAIDRKP